MPMPIPPSSFAGPKKESRANYYERVIMPFQMANYQRSMDEALAEERDADRKIQIRMAYAKALEDQAIELRKIRASLIENKAKAYTNADVQAANARADEELRRLGMAGTTIEGNLDRQTSTSVANIRARGDAAAALRGVERDNLVREKQSLDTFITNEMGTGQVDLNKDLLKQNIYAPIDQLILGDEEGLPSLIRGAETLKQHNRDTGQRYQAEAITSKLTDIKDRVQREGAVSRIWNTLDTAQEKEDFRRSYEVYNKLKNPDDYVDPSTEVARSIGGGGRAYTADPLKDVANIPLPEAQTTETFGRENIDEYYKNALAQADQDLMNVLNKREAVYEEALSYERPSAIDRSREIFWEKYRNGKPPVKPPVSRQPLQEQASMIPTEMSVLPNELDVGAPPAQQASPVQRQSRMEQLITAPRNTSPAPLPAVPNPNQEFEWQGPIQEIPTSRVMGIAPTTSYPTPGFRTEEQAGALGNAFANWYNKIQEERTGLANRSAMMRAQAAADASAKAAEENARIPVVPVKPVQPESRIQPYRPEDPNPIQAPPRVPLTQMIMDGVNSNKGELAQVEPNVKPDMEPAEKPSEKPAVKNLGYQAIELADTYISQPKRFERLLTNDPVVKTAANTYAINKQNGVSSKETIITLNKTFANDSEKRMKAIAVVLALKKKDRLTDTLSGTNKENV